MRPAASPHVGSIGVEHAVIVRLSILGEDLGDLRIGFKAKGLQGGFDHPVAPVRHDRPLERRIGLQADDDLIVLVDVARLVRGDRAWNLRHVEDAFLALLDEQVAQLLPDSQGALGRPGEEAFVAVVRRIVLLNELADIDFLRPQSALNSGRDPTLALAFGIRGRSSTCEFSVEVSGSQVAGTGRCRRGALWARFHAG